MSSHQPTLSIAILGTDAVLGARPASAIQLAHAVLAVGYDAVYPASWGDELVAAGCLQRLGERGGEPAVLCACPLVAQRLLRSGDEISRFMVPMVSPPVTVARYLRAIHAGRRLHITYLGGCPDSDAAEIDARLSPVDLDAELRARKIVVTRQPQYFESVLPPDRRRFYSLPGGAPAPSWLRAMGNGAGTERALVTLGGEDLAAELAQCLLSGERSLIDAAPMLGCVCSGAMQDVEAAAARERAQDAEPPRAATPVVDATVPIELDRELPSARQHEPEWESAREWPDAEDGETIDRQPDARRADGDAPRAPDAEVVDEAPGGADETDEGELLHRYSRSDRLAKEGERRRGSSRTPPFVAPAPHAIPAGDRDTPRDDRALERGGERVRDSERPMIPPRSRLVHRDTPARGTPASASGAGVAGQVPTPRSGIAAVEDRQGASSSIAPPADAASIELALELLDEVRLITDPEDVAALAAAGTASGFVRVPGQESAEPDTEHAAAEPVPEVSEAASEMEAEPESEPEPASQPELELEPELESKPEPTSAVEQPAMAADGAADQDDDDLDDARRDRGSVRRITPSSVRRIASATPVMRTGSGKNVPRAYAARRRPAALGDDAPAPERETEIQRSFEPMVAPADYRPPIARREPTADELRFAPRGGGATPPLADASTARPAAGATRDAGAGAAAGAAGTWSKGSADRGLLPPRPPGMVPHRTISVPLHGQRTRVQPPARGARSGRRVLIAVAVIAVGALSVLAVRQLASRGGEQRLDAASVSGAASATGGDGGAVARDNGVVAPESTATAPPAAAAPVPEKSAEDAVDSPAAEPPRSPSRPARPAVQRQGAASAGESQPVAETRARRRQLDSIARVLDSQRHAGEP